MKSSPIEITKPKVFDNPRISAWFTPANQEKPDFGNKISGLNLGLNTDEDEEVVLENRLLLLNKLGIELQNIAFGMQVHKSDVKFIHEGGVYPDTDAFVTDKPGMTLAIQVADCAAILFGDDEHGVIGAAHAGWRGAVADIVPKTLSRMTDLGAQIHKIKVYISPCISTEKFEVGAEVAEQFPSQFVDSLSFSKPHVDLKGFLNYQLKLEGIPESNIETDEGCTFSDTRFYSYRRQKEKSGRMMGIIRLNE